jgi:hypothetical protein
MCIRDDQGQFIPTKTGWILPILEVDIGEALGLFSALNWVNKLRLEDVDFKLDSRTIVMRFIINEKISPSLVMLSEISYVQLIF